MNIFTKAVLSLRVAANQAVKSARVTFKNPKRGKASLVSNRYEAGQRWQAGNRSNIWSFVTDARFDADQATRTELVRKVRYFEQNNPLVQRLADLWEQYVVGASGLILLPDSEDEQWSAAAAAWFDEWAKFPDLTTRQNWATMQTLIARAWFIDGEIFILKTRGSTPPFRPRLQLIEGHRVATPPGLYGQEGISIIDGVEIDRTGRPIAYHVQEGNDGSVYSRIPAENMIHVFEPSRTGMYRGLTHFAAVINVLHDLDDLALLEMQSAKDAAETTKVVYTPTGEAPDDIQEWENVETSETGAPNPLFEYYRRVFGASTKIAKIGDKYEQLPSNRPSVAQQWYWLYLAEQICVGSAGVPLVMVYPEKAQGTVYRGSLDMMAVTFRSRSKVLEAALGEAWIYVIDAGSRFDSRIANKPKDWTKLVCRPPRSPNVDVGRNSTAMIAELEAGARTLQDTYAETGDDWRQKLRQRAKEAAFIRKLALENGLEPGEIAANAIRELQAEIKLAPKQNAPAI